MTRRTTRLDVLRMSNMDEIQSNQGLGAPFFFFFSRFSFFRSIRLSLRRFSFSMMRSAFRIRSSSGLGLSVGGWMVVG